MCVCVLILERKHYMAELFGLSSFSCILETKPSISPDCERVKSLNIVSSSLFKVVRTEVY